MLLSQFFLIAIEFAEKNAEISRGFSSSLFYALNLLITFVKFRLNIKWLVESAILFIKCCLITSRPPLKVIIVSRERGSWLTWDTGARSEKEKHKITYCLEIFLQSIIKLHLAWCVSVASCSSISSVNGPDHRIRLLPRYYLPIQFCLIFPRPPPFCCPLFLLFHVHPFFVSLLAVRNIII